MDAGPLAGLAHDAVGASVQAMPTSSRQRWTIVVRDLHKWDNQKASQSLFFAVESTQCGAYDEGDVSNPNYRSRLVAEEIKRGP